jgi:hypothetical protein
MRLPELPRAVPELLGASDALGDGVRVAAARTPSAARLAVVRVAGSAAALEGEEDDEEEKEENHAVLFLSQHTRFFEYTRRKLYRIITPTKDRENISNQILSR